MTREEKNNIKLEKEKNILLKDLVKDKFMKRIEI